MVLAEAIDAWREALVRKVCRAVHPDGRGAAGPRRCILDEPADGTGWPLEAAGLAMLFRPSRLICIRE